MSTGWLQSKIATLHNKVVLGSLHNFVVLSRAYFVRTAIALLSPA